MGEVAKLRLATVIPVLNEVDYIEACLDGLLHQTIDPASHMVLVLDGGSIDGTPALVERLIAEHTGPQWPQVVLVDNPNKTVAHARNLAMELLPESVEYMVEMIGHAQVDRNHLQQRLDAWEACESTAGERLAGVGVRVVGVEQKTSQVAAWVDGALASPLGRSGGQFSQFTAISETSTPAFVMHRRASVVAVNGWDEDFLTSQDSELSMRLIKAGFVLRRHPLPEVMMHKRRHLGNWWKMGHRYGFWRTKVLLKHPKRAKWQEFLPLLGLLLTGSMFLVGSPLYWLLPACYGLALLLAGVHQAVVQPRFSTLLGVPLCLLMLHASFSLGLVDGLVRKGRQSSDRG